MYGIVHVTNLSKKLASFFAKNVCVSFDTFCVVAPCLSFLRVLLEGLKIEIIKNTILMSHCKRGNCRMHVSKVTVSSHFFEDDC